MVSLQDTNQKLLETVAKLEKTSEAIASPPPFPPSLSDSSYPLLSEFLCPDLPTLPPPISKEEPIASNKKDKNSPKIIAAPFKEKPTDRGEPALIHIP